MLYAPTVVIINVHKYKNMEIIEYVDLKKKEKKPFLIPAKVDYGRKKNIIGEIGWDPEYNGFLFFLSNELDGYPSVKLLSISKYKYSYAFTNYNYAITAYNVKFLTVGYLNKLKII